MEITANKITSEQYHALLKIPEGHFVDLKGADIKPSPFAQIWR